MSIPQTTPFSLFLYENIYQIRNPFMSPDQVVKIAEEIWNDMPHELKFIYVRKSHELLIERNQNSFLHEEPGFIRFK